MKLCARSIVIYLFIYCKTIIVSETRVYRVKEITTLNLLFSNVRHPLLPAPPTPALDFDTDTQNRTSQTRVDFKRYL